jgi:hypothetical protein
MGDKCRWYRASDVPGGRFLVPGCWNRVIYGDHADCHCGSRDKQDGDRIEDLENEVKKLKAQVAELMPTPAKPD